MERAGKTVLRSKLNSHVRSETVFSNEGIETGKHVSGSLSERSLRPTPQHAEQHTIWR